MAPKESLPVSVCMIAGAEALRIRRALESVAGWAGEIIVVINEDVGDGTDQIALSFGAKVFREPWKGHIAQKNSAAEKAVLDWRLGLDADEEVPAALQEEVRRAIADPGEHSAFSFPRCACFCGRWIRHGDWYPDRQTRLWRKGRARWGGVDPHDKLCVQGRVGRLRADLLHYTADTIDRQLEKMAGYSNDFARGAEKRGCRARWWDLTVRPVWRFLRSYFIRLGFLDGWQGYYIAWMNSFYTLNRYAKVREAALERRQERG
jgi:glycosyltransferase involved in cell wall biosynthesis